MTRAVSEVGRKQAAVGSQDIKHRLRTASGQRPTNPTAAHRTILKRVNLVSSGNMNLKIIIVDDEPEAREGVALLLNDDPDTEVVAVCANGLEAIQAIQDLSPDLLFLDIQMPQINGFEVLNSLPIEQQPAVIFTTAYDEYTLKAFEVHAIDYLLKPFTDERFYRALAHAKELVRSRQSPPLQSLLQAQPSRTDDQNTLVEEGQKAVSDKLIVKSDGRVHFVPHAHIIWVEAYDYYVKIHVKDRYFLLRDRLKHMEQYLPADQFVRIHKSSIVNVHHIASLVPQDSGSEYQVMLTNGVELKSSRSYRERVKALVRG